MDILLFSVIQNAFPFYQKQFSDFFSAKHALCHFQILCFWLGFRLIFSVGWFDFRYGAHSPGHSDWLTKGHMTQESQGDINTISRIHKYLVFWWLQDSSCINGKSPKTHYSGELLPTWQKIEMRHRLKPVLRRLFEQLHEAPAEARMPLD